MIEQHAFIFDYVEAYLAHRNHRVTKIAVMLLEQDGTDVMTPADAAKALRRFVPDATTLSPHELQWEINLLLSQIIPDDLRKFVHVDGACPAPLKRSNRTSLAVRLDIEEITTMWQIFRKECVDLFGF